MFRGQGLGFRAGFLNGLRLLKHHSFTMWYDMSADVGQQTVRGQVPARESG